MSQLIKKLIMPLIIIVVVFIAIMIVVGIINNNKKLDYQKLESELKIAATRYFNNNQALLPTESGETESVSYDVLEENSYIESIEKLLGESVTCNAWADVINNNGNYIYVANLICGDGSIDYSTQTLSEQLLSQVVNSGDGLYKMGNEYVYRGEVVKNYVHFANRIWRVLSIDDNGNIKLLRADVTYENVWDDRYNVELEGDYGVNDYQLSRVREYLDREFQENNYFTNEEKGYIIYSDLCIGERKSNSTDNSGRLECAVKYENQPMGLIQLNEYINASLEKTCKSPSDEQCKNYNYLAKSEGKWWTITKDSDSTNRIYLIREDGKILYGDANYEFRVRPTIILSKYTGFESGDGSEVNPYVIK